MQLNFESGNLVCHSTSETVSKIDVSDYAELQVTYLEKISVAPIHFISELSQGSEKAKLLDLRPYLLDI